MPPRCRPPIDCARSPRSIGRSWPVSRRRSWCFWRPAWLRRCSGCARSARARRCVGNLSRRWWPPAWPRWTTTMRRPDWCGWCGGSPSRRTRGTCSSIARASHTWSPVCRGSSACGHTVQASRFSPPTAGGAWPAARGTARSACGTSSRATPSAIGVSLRRSRRCGSAPTARGWRPAASTDRPSSGRWPTTASRSTRVTGLVLWISSSRLTAPWQRPGAPTGT